MFFLMCNSESVHNIYCIFHFFIAFNVRLFVLYLEHMSDQNNHVSAQYPFVATTYSPGMKTSNRILFTHWEASLFRMALFLVFSDVHSFISNTQSISVVCKENVKSE